MRVAAVMDADLRIPDIPLAKEEDMDSNKNSQNDEFENVVNEHEELRMGDEFSGSLEDLVGNFEEKIGKCLRDHEATTQDIAPVQVRTHDEIMSESQTWWTLTGNFGNIQPLDFHKSMIGKKMLPGLGLKDRKNSEDGGVSSGDEDELRAQMDMHQLVAQGSIGDSSPPQTADQVIEEIDEMLQSCDFTASMMTDRTMESVDSMYSSMRSPLPSGNSSEADAKLRQAQAISANPENLQELSYSKLVTLYAEMEQLIQVYNESLVEELALRDELEYEKEMKNSFISLLLSIQNKRKQFTNERKRKGMKIDPSQLPQYMTACIPFNEGQNIDNSTLSSLIKILKAINDDSATVPSLLTDYILTVVCPKTAMC